MSGKEYDPMEIRHAPPYPTQLLPLGRRWLWEWRLPDSAARDAACWALKIQETGFNLGYCSGQSLAAAIERHAPVPPAMFIFHMSRCGSTVLSRALECDPENRVFVEPAVLSQLYWSHHEITDSAMEMLPLAVGGLGYGAPSPHRRLIVKFCSPHIHTMLEPLATSYPDAKIVFVHRDPIEVLVSNLVNPPSMVTHPNWERLAAETGMTVGALRRLTRPELTAHWIRCHLESALRWRHLLWKLVDYAEIRSGFDSLQRALNPDGVMLKGEELSRVWGENAKQRGEQFRPDSAAKQKKASLEVRELAKNLLKPIYDQLTAGTEG